MRRSAPVASVIDICPGGRLINATMMVHSRMMRAADCVSCVRARLACLLPRPSGVAAALQKSDRRQRRSGLPGV